MQRKRVARHLQDGTTRAFVSEPGEQCLHFVRERRRVLETVLERAAQLGAECADEPERRACGRCDRFDEMRGRRLPVGSGDAGDIIESLG
jgi:hypothetical protein